MDNLSGKIVFITGASSGIGEEMAYEAARQGATLVLSARREEKLDSVKTVCESISNAPAYSFPLDVSDPELIEQTIDNIHEEVGIIDVLINNAGFGHTEDFLIYDMQKGESMFRVNVLALMYISQLVALQMLENNSGHIINIGSISGKVATPKTAVYSASKSAVISFSNALRLELKPLNIHVTTVNTGPVDTDFFEQFDPEGEYLKKIEAFVLTPEKVAKKTIKVIGRKKRELNMPLALAGASRLYQLSPHLGDFLISTMFNLK